MLKLVSEQAEKKLSLCYPWTPAAIIAWVIYLSSRKLLWRACFLENEHFTHSIWVKYCSSGKLGPPFDNCVLSSCNVERKESTWFSQLRYHPVFLYGRRLFSPLTGWSQAVILKYSSHVPNISYMCWDIIIHIVNENKINLRSFTKQVRCCVCTVSYVI